MGVRHLAAAAAISCILFPGAVNAHASIACHGDADVAATASPQTALALLCDINVLRIGHGLPPVRWNWRLWIGAQRMAGEMGRKQFFAHTTPDGRNLVDRIEPTGYLPDTPTWVLAENLAWGTDQLSTPLSVALGWMNSPGHRRNLLDPQLTDVGIGIVAAPMKSSSREGLVYVADFGTQGIPPHGHDPAARRTRSH